MKFDFLRRRETEGLYASIQGVPFEVVKGFAFLRRLYAPV